MVFYVAHRIQGGVDLRAVDWTNNGWVFSATVRRSARSWPHVALYLAILLLSGFGYCVFNVLNCGPRALLRAFTPYRPPGEFGAFALTTIDRGGPACSACISCGVFPVE